VVPLEQLHARDGAIQTRPRQIVIVRNKQQYAVMPMDIAVCNNVYYFQ
jgi:hypothetical protein